ncbi:MAG: hypothetical protein Q4F38_00900 [Akkermansia sp.]|nr:hypothetical protein [Akkermansia sp.]
MKRVLLSILAVIAVLAVLLIAAWHLFCYWVNSWQSIEPPVCHESWSEQQKADLLDIDNSLRNSAEIAGLTFFYEGELAPGTQWLRKRKWGMIPALLLGRRELCMTARAALHESMRSGKGDILLTTGIPVADFALKFHKFDLLKEFIRRGADPNHVYVPWTAPVASTSGGQSNLIWETFNGVHLDFETIMPPDTRLELLDFMLAHGGNVASAPNQKLAELYALLPLVSADDNDKGLSTAWALRHGLSLNNEHKNFCVNHMQKCNPALLKELQQERLLPATSETPLPPSPAE